MIPVLGVPVLTGYPLLRRMLGSVDVPVERVMVIDNGGGMGPVPGALVSRMPENLGVAASWNLIIKANPSAPWWAIVNHDVEFAPGDLEALATAMGAGVLIATLAGFAAFGLSRECVRRVGLFDENFIPAYCEDADYEWRCRLAGVEIVALPANLRHDTSATLTERELRMQNSRTYNANRAYYARKWGGELRGGETHTSPFGEGGRITDTTLDFERVVEFHWTWQEPEETTALEPVGHEVR